MHGNLYVNWHVNISACAENWIWPLMLWFMQHRIQRDHLMLFCCIKWFGDYGSTLLKLQSFNKAAECYMIMSNGNMSNIITIIINKSFLLLLLFEILPDHPPAHSISVQDHDQRQTNMYSYAYVFFLSVCSRLFLCSKLWSSFDSLCFLCFNLTIRGPRTWALTLARLISSPSSSVHSLIPFRPSSAIWWKVIWCSMHTGRSIDTLCFVIEGNLLGTELNLFMVRSPTATRDVSVPACHTSTDFLLCIFPRMHK